MFEKIFNFMFNKENNANKGILTIVCNKRDVDLYLIKESLKKRMLVEDYSLDINIMGK